VGDAARNQHPDNYAQIRTSAGEFYSGIGRVHCPAFDNDWIYFTSEGFNHLVYKTKKKPRDGRVQITRFRLLPRAKRILEIATTFQEYEETFKNVRSEHHGKSTERNVLVRAWGFVAILQNSRVRVVVRQIGNGKKEFYSVIPAWFVRQYRGIRIIETSTRDGLLGAE
jgi:hypothetical protein